MTGRAGDDRVRYIARRLGLRASNCGSKCCGDCWRLLDADSRLLLAGRRADVEGHLAQKYRVPPRRRLQAGFRLKPLPLEWESAIGDYLRYLTAAGQRAATLKLRDQQLRNFARGMGCEPADVTAEAIIEWFGQQTWSLEHRRSNRFALKGFFTWAHKTQRLPSDLSDVMPKMPQPQGVPRPAPDDVWAATLATADSRLQLMLRLAGEAGLRRAEVAQVHTRDVVVAAAASQLLVRGKGGKQRLVPISDELAAAVWAGPAGHTPGGPSHGWLFPDEAGGHLTANWVGQIVSSALPPGYTMHTLRHRYATRAYRGSRNLRAVQTLLGHTSVATTQRYCAVTEDEVRAAMMAAL